MANQSIGKSDTRGNADQNIIYRDPEPFDWYQRFNGIKDQLL
jgi:hypothetical protein